MKAVLSEWYSDDCLSFESSLRDIVLRGKMVLSKEDGWSPSEPTRKVENCGRRVIRWGRRLWSLLKLIKIVI